MMSDDAPTIDPKETHLDKAWKHVRPLVACRFDPSGKYAFTGAEDNLLSRWDLSAEGDAAKVSTPFAAHDSWVRAIGFSPSGDTVYSGGYDGRLIWWPASAEKPEPIRKIEPAHQGWIRALAVSPDGTRIATCGNDKLVKLWDAADGRLVAELPGHESHVYNVAFHPTDGTLVSCDLKGVLKQWDTTSSTDTATNTSKRDLAAAALYKYDTNFRADIGGARSIAFGADGKQLALGGITNVTNAFAGIGHAAVVVLDWETGKPAIQYEGKEKVNGTVWGLAWHSGDSNSGDLDRVGFWIGLSGGGGGGWLYFWKEAAAPEFHKLKLPDTGRDMSLSSDGRRVCVAHFDGNLRTYNLWKKG